MDNITDYKITLFSTPLLKTLDFLLQNPDVEFSDADIEKVGIGTKRSAINLALRTLEKMELVSRRSIGRTVLNKLLQNEPLIIYFKVVSNILTLSELVRKCRPYSSRIVLFGSRADGTNQHDSDFDMIITADDVDAVRKITGKIKLPLQIIVKRPEEMIGLHREEPALSGAVAKGIVLWERK